MKRYILLVSGLEGGLMGRSWNSSNAQDLKLAGTAVLLIAWVAYIVFDRVKQYLVRQIRASTR